MLARYLWNTMLAESLYPVLQYLEVGLRNSLHTAIATAYGHADWYDLQPPILEPKQRHTVQDAKDKLREAHKPVTTGRIVAELTFGFWTSLFNRPYEAKPSGDARLWPRILADVFPAMPRRQRTRHAISTRLNDIRALRNRVFHHEPIWHYARLTDQYGEVVETMRWINPDLHQLAALLDRFPDVQAQGLAQCRTALASLVSPS